MQDFRLHALSWGKLTCNVTCSRLPYTSCILSNCRLAILKMCACILLSQTLSTCRVTITCNISNWWLILSQNQTNFGHLMKLSTSFGSINVPSKKHIDELDVYSMFGSPCKVCWKGCPVVWAKENAMQLSVKLIFVHWYVQLTRVAFANRSLPLYPCRLSWVKTKPWKSITLLIHSYIKHNENTNYCILLPL